MAGSVSIERSNYSINEADGSGVISVRIVRTNSLEGEVSVSYSTVANTATAGEDFVATVGTVTFAPGETFKQIDIPIINDTLPEGTERFNFVIDGVSGGSLIVPRTADISILDDEAPSPEEPEPSALPYDVTVDAVTIVDGLEGPMTMQFLPNDPDVMLVAEKAGRIRAFRDGVELPMVLDITEKVNTSADRGLMDIELDPNFPDSPYVYAIYVYDPPETQASAVGAPAGPDGLANRPARVVRFEVDFDADGNPTIDPASEEILVGEAGTWENISGPDVDSAVDLDQPPSGIDPVTGENIQDYIAVDSSTHAPGDIEFGPDGMLYVSIGDGTSYNAVDPRSLRVQDVNNLSGKVLRIDPATGQGLADNPFFNGDLDSNASKVWQMGLRNGFRMDFDPVTGDLWIGDVGWTLWEQLETGGAGANFGWPFYEGAFQQPIYSELPEAQAFYDAVANGEINLVLPVHSFSHDPVQDGPDMSAINVGAIYQGDAYPEVFDRDIFFADFAGGAIYTMDLDDPTRTIRALPYRGSFLSDYVLGPDGKIYVSSVYNGTIQRLDITEGSVDSAAFNYTTFAGAADLSYNGTAAVAGGAARLTQAVGADEAGTLFHTNAIIFKDDTSFSTDFAFRVGGGDGDYGADGFTFVLQASGAGTQALGSSGGGLGYSGIGNSLAIAFDTFQGGDDLGANRIQVLINGEGGRVIDVPIGFDLNATAAPKHVWLDYDGGSNTLGIYMSEGTMKPAAPIANVTVDIPLLLGGVGYAGFTAATGGLSNQHDILSWKFESGQRQLSFDLDDMTTSGTVINLNGSATPGTTGLLLTTGEGEFETGSAFYEAPLNVTANTSFSTSFGFRVGGGDGAGGADGFTFVIQSDDAGASALGGAGGGLGYGDIGESLAIAFDTFQSAGDSGDNQLVLLRNGDVVAKLADVDLPFDVNGTADTRRAWIDYNGATNQLRVYLSESATKPTAATMTATVDLAALVDDQAFVGFTAATGGLTNRHEITDWDFTSSATAPQGARLAISALSATKPEGTDPTTPTEFTFTVTRTGDASDAASVNYTVAGTGEPPATADDFAGGIFPTGTITFNAGETSKVLTIPVIADTMMEASEGFRVTLSGAVGATISTATAFGSIQNDDTTPASGTNFAYAGFGGADDIVFNGSAAASGTVARLTQAVGTFEAGSMFRDEAMDFDADTSFSTSFDFRMAGGDGAGGADGMTFVLQSSAAGTGALGGVGGGMGYGDIGASVAIAFDTWQGPGDSGDNQIEVLVNGDVVEEAAGVAALFDLNGLDATNFAWVDYDGETDLLSVYLSQTATKPVTAALTTEIDLDAILGPEVLLGFTAATGGLRNQHDVSRWAFASDDFLV